MRGANAAFLSGLKAKEKRKKYLGPLALMVSVEPHKPVFLHIMTLSG